MNACEHRGCECPASAIAADCWREIQKLAGMVTGVEKAVEAMRRNVHPSLSLDAAVAFAGSACRHRRKRVDPNGGPLTCEDCGKTLGDTTLTPVGG